MSAIAPDNATPQVAKLDLDRRLDQIREHLADVSMPDIEFITYIREDTQFLLEQVDALRKADLEPGWLARHVDLNASIEIDTDLLSKRDEEDE